MTNKIFKKLSKNNYFSFLYICALCFLGLRPIFPAFYNTFLPESSAGAWNMYTDDIEDLSSCYLIVDNDSIIIDWKKYFYHSTFVSSAHPNYREYLGDDFVEFLLNNDSTVKHHQAFSTTADLLLIVSYVVDKQDTITYEYYRNK
jgi:hypothetical protein